MLVYPGVQYECLVLVFPRRLPGCSSSIHENIYFPSLIVLAIFIICRIYLDLFMHRYYTVLIIEA